VRGGVDADLSQVNVAGADKSMRSAGGDDDDLTALPSSRMNVSS
jgi:hypothetical protein